MSDDVHFVRLDAQGRLLTKHLFMPGGVATLCGMFIPADAKLPPTSAGHCKVCSDMIAQEHPTRRLR